MEDLGALMVRVRGMPRGRIPSPNGVLNARQTFDYKSMNAMHFESRTATAPHASIVIITVRISCSRLSSVPDRRCPSSPWFSRTCGLSVCIFTSTMSSTYIVKTMPPLSDNLTKRGTAPDQNASMLSSRIIRVAQWNVFLYSARASIDCILP